MKDENKEVLNLLEKILERLDLIEFEIAKTTTELEYHNKPRRDKDKRDGWQGE